MGTATMVVGAVVATAGIADAPLAVSHIWL